MVGSGVSAPRRRLAAVTALALALAAVSQAGAAGPHERACGAAFGVLRHCAAADGRREGVRARCCGLLEAFQHNGCLCPDCPPGASADATSAKGLLLAAELSPLMDLCGAVAASSQQAQQAQQAPDEDDLAADMAGLAAAAQDPAAAGRLAQDAAAAAGAAAAAAAEAQREQRQLEFGGSPLLDTPEDDYDNLLSDADAAFMLVDPAAARSYAVRAASVARGVAADVASRLRAGRAAAADLESELQARLEALLAGRAFAGSGVADGSGGERAEAEQRAAEEAELVASASAVSDEGAAEEDELPTSRSSLPVRLARAGAVPQTAEHRRAAALAAAVEAQQAAGLAQRAQRLSREAGSGKKLSLDITIDADNPEAARRMIGSLAALLKTWQAAGMARSQAELAAVLESTTAKVAAAAAAAGPLGRAGLQPRQLELRQVEEQASEPRLCACMDVELPPLDGPAPDFAAASRRRYLVARLALCRFACQHQQTLAALLVAEVALCCAWLALWLLRGCAAGDCSDEEELESRYMQGGRCHWAPAKQPQFLIASAADPQWQAELKQPLLPRRDDTAGSSSTFC